MVIFTTKLTRGKKLALAAGAIALVLILVLILRGGGDPTKGLNTNAERVAYLQACGLAVDPEPIQTQEVRVPEADSQLLQEYNRLQTRQGFDLSAYAGQRVKRYVYRLENGAGEVCMLFSGSRLIGGDITLQGDAAGMQGLPIPEQG